MGELEIKVLELLNREYDITYIIRELNIKDEHLADIIIGLDDDKLIMLKDKKWKITEKGRDIFEKRDQLFKKLKIEYLYGEIGREEYNRRMQELGDISQFVIGTEYTIDSVVEKDQIEKDQIEKDRIEKQEITRKKAVQPEMTVTPERISEKKNEDNISTGKLSKEPVKKICPKCGIENKPESNYCRKCGTILNL